MIFCSNKRSIPRTLLTACNESCRCLHSFLFQVCCRLLRLAALLSSSGAVGMIEGLSRVGTDCIQILTGFAAGTLKTKFLLPKKVMTQARLAGQYLKKGEVREHALLLSWLRTLLEHTGSNRMQDIFASKYFFTLRRHTAGNWH